jgi:hypothetical protein
MGVRDPEAALKQQDPPVPQSALDMLVQMGFDKRLIEYAVQTAQQQDPQLQQGPSTAQVTQMMGGEPDQPRRSSRRSRRHEARDRIRVPEGRLPLRGVPCGACREAA